MRPTPSFLAPPRHSGTVALMIRALSLTLACLAAGGCAALPVARELARPEQTVVSPPGEDGTRYLAVEGGALASPAAVRNRWHIVARQVCGGEYMKLSDASLSRRASGLTQTRVHEGYIRCVLPGESEPGATPKAPTAADATPPAQPRARRANLARNR